MCGLARQQALAVLCALAIAWSLPVAGVAAIGTAGAQEQFEGEIVLEGNQATSSTSWSYDIEDLDAVDGLSADLVGDRVTEARSKSATTESETLDIDPRGTSDPEDAVMRLEGVNSGETETRSGSLSPGESDSITVGGDDIPENAELTIKGEYSESSGSSSSSWPNVGGSLEPTGESITTSSSSTTDNLYHESDAENGINTGGDEEPYTESVSSSEYSGDYVEEVTFSILDDDPCSSHDYVAVDGAGFYNEVDSGSNIYTDCSGASQYYDVTVPVGEELDGFEWQTFNNNRFSSNYMYNVDVTSSQSGPHSVTVNGQSYSVSGSESIDLDLGSNSVSTDSSLVSHTVTWTERDGVSDVDVSVDGNTVSESGVFDGETSESIDLSRGTHEIEADYEGSGLEYEIEWAEREYPENPSIDLAGETIAEAGALEPGETREEPIDLSAGETYSADVSSDGPVEASVEWDDVSESVDPSVTVNGETAAYTGTLEEGETTSLDVSDNWIQEGTNTVDISMADAGGGPEPQVDVTYQHDAATAATATIDSTTWTEDAEINRTFASDQSNVEATIPMPDRVVEVDGVEISRDGGGWSSVDEADYSHDGDLQVSIGSVTAGESVAVRSEGSKVRMQSGEIEVVDPTTEGNDLSSTVEIVDAAGTDPVVVDVSETVSSDRAHVVSESEWTTDDSVLYQADGTQELRLPDAVGGSTATIETAPFDIEPQTGEAVLRVENRTEPRISLSPGSTSGDSLSLTWFDGESSQHYELYDVDNDRQVDTGQANSPVLFDDVDDQEATLVIYEWEPSGSIAGVASGDGEGGLGAPLLLLVSLLGLVGSVVVGTRLGVRWLPIPALAVIVLVGGELSTSRSLLATLSGDLLRGSSGPLLAIVAAVLGLAILWVVDSRTARDVPTAAYAIPAVAGLAWLVSEVVTGVPEPLIAFVGGVAVVVGVVALDRQTSLSVPQPIIGGAGIMAFAWVIETIEPGTITRPLEAGIAEVAPLLALASIGLLIWWVRR